MTKTIKKKFTLSANVILVALSVVLVIVIGVEVFMYIKRPGPGIDNQQINKSEFLSIKECFSGEEDSINACFEEFIGSYGEGKTISQLLSDLETSRSLDTQLESNCHPIVHAIGRLAYKREGNIGDAFESCDLTCHSGCYHGVMERLFFTEEELASGEHHLTYNDLQEKIPGICDRDKFTNFSTSIQFQCLHGLGHAILYSLEYDLETALKSCDLLVTEYEKSSCHGGVIMENVTAFDKEKRDLKKNDPLYPCNKLESKYMNSCYLMQTSVMLEYGMSTKEIAEKCATVDTYGSTCFVSLGRDLSNQVRIGNTESVVEACEIYSEKYVHDCIKGTIYALIDNTWSGEFAYGFCNRLKNENMNFCYQASNEYLKNVHEKSIADVKSNCNQFAKEGKDICITNI